MSTLFAFFFRHYNYSQKYLLFFFNYDYEQLVVIGYYVKSYAYEMYELFEIKMSRNLSVSK